MLPFIVSKLAVNCVKLAWRDEVRELILSAKLAMDDEELEWEEDLWAEEDFWLELADYDADVGLAEVDFVTWGVATSTGQWGGPELLGPTWITSMGVVTSAGKDFVIGCLLKVTVLKQKPISVRWSHNTGKIKAGLLLQYKISLHDDRKWQNKHQLECSQRPPLDKVYHRSNYVWPTLVSTKYSPENSGKEHYCRAKQYWSGQCPPDQQKCAIWSSSHVITLGAW